MISRLEKYVKEQIIYQKTNNLSFDRCTNMSDKTNILYIVIVRIPYAAFHSKRTQNHCTIQEKCIAKIGYSSQKLTILKVAVFLTVKAGVKFNNFHVVSE